MIGKIFSPIVQAIALAEAGTTGEIRVHLSKRWLEPDPLKRAQKLFSKFGMHRTTHRNAVLLYVNLRRHKFAIVGDEGLHRKVGQTYWAELGKSLSDSLRSTHPEKAIAEAVHQVGETLRAHFPADPNGRNPNELGNEVTED